MKVTQFTVSCSSLTAEQEKAIVSALLATIREVEQALPEQDLFEPQCDGELVYVETFNI